jgi:hypothetical protein
MLYYFKSPLEKGVGDSAYEGLPEKVTVSSPVTVEMFLGSLIGLKTGKKHIMPS